MIYRRLKKELDYPILKGLWEKSPMKVPPEYDMLPTDGVVVEDKDKGVMGCLFFFTMSNASSAIIGFPIFDDDYREDDRDEIINKLFKEVDFLLTYHGYKYVYHFTNLPFVKQRLQGNGYVFGDRSVDMMLKITNQR